MRPSLKIGFEALFVGWCRLCWLFVIVLSASCRTGQPTPTGIAVPSVEVTATDLPSPAPTIPVQPTETNIPPLAVLLASPGSSVARVDQLYNGLAESFSERGLRWEVRTALNPAEIDASLRLVILLPPDPGASQMASAFPQIQFLAVGIPGLSPAPNLSVVGALGERYDQQGFLAGIIAAMITPDWRVGVISLSDSSAGKAARQGFLNGAAYFCGLCLAYHGPIFDYPQFAELPSTATDSEWQTAADILLKQAVKTVYVFPEITAPGLLEYLANLNVRLLGSGTPSDALRSVWVASVEVDALPVIKEILPDLLAGRGGQDKPLPVTVKEVNAELFTPGKQALLEEMRIDLIEGWIDTGVDPITGEPR